MSATAGTTILACPDCDALQAEGAGSGTGIVRTDGRDALCFRCGALLARGGGDRLDRSLALTLGAIPLFFAASFFPLMRLEVSGQRIEASVLGAVRTLHRQESPVLAGLVLLLTTILPAVWLAGVGYLLLALRRRRMAAALPAVFRLVEVIGPWSQIEILLLGMLVAFGKLAGLFHMVPGVALPCMVGFLLLARLIRTSLDPRYYWRRMAMGMGPGTATRTGGGS
jgi:paraquat-inducible protein A